jgi:nitrile hydratase accessory protein
VAEERAGAASELDLDGPAAPPRKNGELVFRAPWESRLFGLTMTLQRSGAFGWEEFRARLIDAIAAAEADPEHYSYWRCWQRAFESLLEAKGLCAGGDLDARTRTLAARPPGHDHGAGVRRQLAQTSR